MHLKIITSSGDSIVILHCFEFNHSNFSLHQLPIQKHESQGWVSDRWWHKCKERQRSGSHWRHWRLHLFTECQRLTLMISILLINSSLLKVHAPSLREDSLLHPTVGEDLMRSAPPCRHSTQCLAQPMEFKKFLLWHRRRNFNGNSQQVVAQWTYSGR